VNEDVVLLLEDRSKYILSDCCRQFEGARRIAGDLATDALTKQPRHLDSRHNSQRTCRYRSVVAKPKLPVQNSMYEDLVRY